MRMMPISFTVYVFTMRGFLKIFQSQRLTVCVSRLWVGVDSARKREKLKARKMLKKRAESHKSAARFVGWL